MTMKLELPYGTEKISAIVPDHQVEKILSMPNSDRMEEELIIRHAFQHPEASKKFEAFLSNAHEILIIVNDADRDNPTPFVLDYIVPFLEKRPIQFLIATGTHPYPTEKDLQKIFGNHLTRFNTMIEIHQATALENCVFVGRTQRGTEVKLNRLVVEANHILVIGSVEPHYFAGFTGGRKAFLPGCSAYETVEQNHKLALNPNAQVLRLKGNPVHEDMEEVLKFLRGKSIFSIQTVFDRNGKLTYAFAGDLEETFLQGVKASLKIHTVPVAEPGDIVIGSVSPPLDVNLYQAHKAHENVKEIIREGGIFILVAPCKNGIGNDAFARLLRMYSDPQKVIEEVHQNYRLGFHKSARIAEFVQRAQFWAVSELDPELVRSLFIRPFPNLQSAIDEALKQKPNGKIVVVSSAGTTVPILKNKEPK